MENATHALCHAASQEAHEIISISGEDATTCRLMEMGFGEGVAVSIEKCGCPAIVRVGYSRVAMSRDLMSRVNVRCIH